MMLLRCLLLHCKPSENSCVSRAHILLPLSHQLALAIPEPTKFNKRKNTFFWGFRQHLLKCSLCAQFEKKSRNTYQPFFPIWQIWGSTCFKRWELWLTSVVSYRQWDWEQPNLACLRIMRGGRSTNFSSQLNISQFVGHYSMFSQKVQYWVNLVSVPHQFEEETIGSSCWANMCEVYGA